jgi:hypothetical protein
MSFSRIYNILGRRYMSECICSSCRNLRGIMDEDGAVEIFECAYGFPSESCNTCETGECELTCGGYINDEEQVEPVIVHCSICGRELQQLCGNDEEGRVQCIDCFLKGSN